MKKGMSMRSGNKGLTVRLNLFPPDDNSNSKNARLNIVGQVTNADNGETEKFNDPGKLLSVLGKWNVEKYKELKKKNS